MNFKKFTCYFNGKSKVTDFFIEKTNQNKKSIISSSNHSVRDVAYAYEFSKIYTIYFFSIKSAFFTLLLITCTKTK